MMGSEQGLGRALALVCGIYGLLLVGCSQSQGPNPGTVAADAAADASTDGSSDGATDGSADGSSDGSADAATDGGSDPPFEPDPARVYVAKVKNVLLGLPATDAEVAAVEADPRAFPGLIDGWLQHPAYATKLLRFFELAFQQTQISSADLDDQTYPRKAVLNPATRERLARNVRESFARTVLQHIAEGKAFSEAFTTQSFMLTPALMTFYAFLDAWQVDNTGKVTDRLTLEPAATKITVSAKSGPIPLAETLDPKSQNYMHWYHPDVGSALLDPGCDADPIVYEARSDVLHYLLHGSLAQRKLPGGQTCSQYRGSELSPQLTSADFETWKLVTVRAPAAGEQHTAFYDLATLRSGTELVLSAPRVGFFSTPAFFANWQTNTSNQMRVTLNQALIVALGAAVDGTDPTAPTSTPGLDGEHAARAECVFCHQTLDPTRSIFAASYSWGYHDQTEPLFADQKGRFVFREVEKDVTTLADFGAVLATHPLFASAWAQKLCWYVGSAPCVATDPELQRVVSAFADSGYAWNTLVRELLASPLITHAAATLSAERYGAVVAVSRRDHLCEALNQRLGLSDICALNETLKRQRATIPEIAAGLPSDGYGRGGVEPVLPTEPTLLYRAGIENLCASVAELVIDPKQPAGPAVKVWSSTDPDAALADFVALLMALSAVDPRALPARELLRSHYDSALETGATATSALRSTFVVACLAPSSLSLGL